MKTAHEKTNDFDRYLNSTYADCGKEFGSHAEAAAFAFGKPHARITKLMKGVPVNNPKSTEGLHKVVHTFKGANNVENIAIHWFDRMPSGRYLVSLV